MLTSKPRTPAETARYLAELTGWLNDVRDTPAEEMAAFFAARRDIYEQVHLSHWADEYAHIADYFDDGMTSLLDIGCGTGLELRSLFTRFPSLRVTGIDLSAPMLAQLRDTYADKDVTLIEADYFTHPLPEAAFDAALSFETLHHFPYAKKQTIYDKLYRTIRRGGYYIECDYVACCAEEEALCLEGYAYRRRQAQMPDDALVHIDIPLTLAHQVELLETAGFSAVRVLYEKESTIILRAQR